MKMARAALEPRKRVSQQKLAVWCHSTRCCNHVLFSSVTKENRKLWQHVLNVFRKDKHVQAYNTPRGV